jgi:hypothetical protein
VCLHTWMTHELVLLTGKHTSAIWRFFQCCSHQRSRH